MNKVVIGGVSLALVLSVIAIFNPGKDGAPGRDGRDGQLGAIPGDSIDSRTFTNNGVTRYHDSLPFNSATSTFCVVQRPSATSTLVSFTAKNTSATSTSVLYVLEKRTIPSAPILSAATSTSVIASATLSANDDALFRVTATSTLSSTGQILSGTGNDLLEVTPSDYLVLYGKNGGSGSINQATSIGTVFSGQCNSVLQEVQ